MAYLPDRPGYDELRLMLQSEGRRLLVVAEMPDGVMYKNYAELNVAPEEIEEALASLPRAMDAVNRSLYVDTSDAVMSIGNRLCKAVLGGRLWPVYQQLARGVESQGRRLRLRLVIDTPSLLNIPWEFMYDDTVRKDFFALSLQAPIIRANAVRDLAPSRPVSGPPRVLVVVSEVLPYDYGAKDEVGYLRALASAKQIELIERPNITPTDLLEAISSQPYDILHLIMSGVWLKPAGGWSTEIFTPRDNAEQALVCRAEKRVEPVTVDQLRGALQKQSGVSLVCLSGDRTDWLAAQLTPVCPMVVGWRGANTAEAYLSFGQGFYAALLEEQPLEAAVTRGRQKISYDYPGGREWSMPVCYLQVLDGQLLSAAPQKTDTSKALPASDGGQSGGREQQRLRAELDIELKNWEELQRRKSVSQTVSPLLEMQLEDTRKNIEHLQAALGIPTEGQDG
ncbi:MAG: CHAT domain-containing protein [Anaerolineae bacterium]|nr:CHAT domain-containing protein [Anaerolineae bacterium]